MSNTDEVADQLTLLNTYRKSLFICLQQQAMHGIANVPLSIIHNIDDCRSNIRKIKRFLRLSGISVKDLPGDEDVEDTTALLEDLESKLASPSKEER